MSAWLGLLKKECRLGFIGFLIAFMLMMVILIFGVINTFRYHAPEAIFAVGAFIIGGHIFYFLGYMIVSLSLERKTLHLWLNSPRSGAALLSAKLVSGILALLVSMAAAGLYTLFGVLFNTHLLKEMNLTLSEMIRSGLSICVIISLNAIYIGLIFTFIWTLYQTLRSKIGKWVWLVIIALIFIAPSVLGKLEFTGLYRLLTHWGAINFHLIANSAITVYSGTFIFHFVIAMILFAISSWLLDRQIEVS
ncbi:hypothetical protein JOD45_001936 [Scopulibacillus daqui]|uniref:ABC transporter permease n=1 Tax=Scopulibacillus daqui TaxID=1469162 RepID=A0ABS2Q096_9BACL|nr:hypothetical protein [Scopulibacillus daqui]MBM7645717.1 hypothetical protein [Scopulibacillus daqui]